MKCVTHVVCFASFEQSFGSLLKKKKQSVHLKYCFLSIVRSLFCAVKNMENGKLAVYLCLLARVMCFTVLYLLMGDIIV